MVLDETLHAHLDPGVIPFLRRNRPLGPPGVKQDRSFVCASQIPPERGLPNRETEKTARLPTQALGNLRGRVTWISNVSPNGRRDKNHIDHVHRPAMPGSLP